MGAYLMCDMAHISGLVAAQECNDPFRCVIDCYSSDEEVIVFIFQILEMLFLLELSSILASHFQILRCGDDDYPQDSARASCRHHLLQKGKEVRH